MMRGSFHDDHPRITITLPGTREDFELEFIADTGFAGTGFAGDLSLPVRLVNQAAVTLLGSRTRRLATVQKFQCPYGSILLDWEDEVRPTEVLILEGEPLLGTVLMREYLFQAEMIEGGVVAIEPL